MSRTPYDHDLERGMRNRRAILGDDWVDRSIANANEFSADFQAFITRYAWHEIWGRPGLDPKTRRVIVLAVTSALGRWEEFDLHLRAALTGSEATRLSRDEVKEALMQVAIYAGVPAANTAMSHAQKILREIGQELAPLPATQTHHSGVGREALTRSEPALVYSVREPRSGAAPRHTVVLAHALGCDSMMWDDFANALAQDCRVIAFDARGHGQSAAPAGPYSMAELADDAQRLLSELDAGEVVWVGLSMGGMVGQELALRHPDRVKALVLANTTSGYPAEGVANWDQRIAAVREGGLASIADAVMQRWFHEEFRRMQPATVARWRDRVASTDRQGYLGWCEAIKRHDTTARLRQIRKPTLVIAGELDAGTPVAMSQLIAREIPNARLIVLPQASHLSVLEQPVAFEAAVQGFLAGL
jgi:3-oxoadipate enol-lactonase